MKCVGSTGAAPDADTQASSTPYQKNLPRIHEPRSRHIPAISRPSRGASLIGRMPQSARVMCGTPARGGAIHPSGGSWNST